MNIKNSEQIKYFTNFLKKENFLNKFENSKIKIEINYLQLLIINK